MIINITKQEMQVLKDYYRKEIARMEEQSRREDAIVRKYIPGWKLLQEEG